MEQLAYAEPTPEWTWQLVVVQQVLRGRKCGFGDKDRRPLTPPLIVQLVVRRSQQEYDIVPPDDIDLSFYVIAVDLRQADGTDANLIASAKYPYLHTDADDPSASTPADTFADGSSVPSTSTTGVYDSTQVNNAPSDVSLSPNLVGSLHVGFSRLVDLQGRKGLFAIFNDLSVRSEGVFRLRLRVMCIGGHGHRADSDTSVLATVMTDPFVISSAKQFAGMVDPTELSKHFASQGVRIPTRKTAKGRRAEDEEQ